MTPVWERAVHSVYCMYRSWAFVNFCMCPSVPFGIEGRMWVVIVLTLDHCLSVYFVDYSDYFLIISNSREVCAEASSV